MSIETLLEAAKFLELQAQQQQRAREEHELRDKLRLEQLSEHRRGDVVYTSPLRMNHVNVNRVEERRPAPLPPPLPPPSMPPSITMIPIPVVTPNSNSTHSHTAPPLLAPATALCPPPASPHLASPRRDPHSPQDNKPPPLPLSPQVKTNDHSPSASSGNHNHNHNHNHQQQQQQQQQKQSHHHPVSQSGSPNLQPPPHLIHPYPGSMVVVPQHALLPQPGPPPPPQAPPPPMPTSPVSRGSPPDDGRNLDNKKRPGGAGTRDVHNKLEKNRRAHLKDCFETLKKTIPNVDEKKTSNLSVLRSALRYIQTLKRKEKEYEHEMERLAREKIATQQRLAELKNELSQSMDVMEIDRMLRQTVQPEEDQASTSTASEGEDVLDDDMDLDNNGSSPLTALPTVPHALQPELRKTVTPITTITPTPTTASLLTQHIAIQAHPHPHPHPLTLGPPLAALSALPPPSLTATSLQALLPAHTHIVTHASPSLGQPTVIAHASASHASVIQAVNHVLQTGGTHPHLPKHIAHLSSPVSPNATMRLTPGLPHHHHHHHHHHINHQPINHITVHPVAHLGQHHHLPTLYPQPVGVGVAQPTMMGHITHTLAHAQVNGSAHNQQAAAMVSKQQQAGTLGAQVVTHHHQQLMGQAVLNPVTMVTMPSFPVSTLKLA